MKPPVVLFAFNRPDKLERVLAALRTQDIDHLIVFVDGPRDDADVELVERCRAIAREVDWVDKELHIGEQNRGLPGLSDNVSTVLKVYKAAVFVEDDCLPMPGFYSFMQQALSYYEPEKQVFSIGGYQLIQKEYFKNYTYSLVSSARFTCWGWATWQDRWELIAPYLSRYWELFDNLTNVPDVAGHDLGDMARACTDGTLETWDVQVAISMLWLEQVQLLPTRGLVRNIGGDTGVHGVSTRSRQWIMHNQNVYEHLLENIVWLENVKLNSDYAEKLKQFVRDISQLPIHHTPSQKLRYELRKVPFLVGFWRLLRRTKTQQ